MITFSPWQILIHRVMKSLGRAPFGWSMSGGLWTGVCVVQNKKGVTPPSSALHDHVEEQRLAVPEHVRPRPYGVVGSGTARKAMSHMRVRWGGRITRLRPRDVVPLAEMRVKATCAPHVRSLYGQYVKV